MELKSSLLLICDVLPVNVLSDGVPFDRTENILMVYLSSTSPPLIFIELMRTLASFP